MVIIAKKTKLNFRFHNPNSLEETADYIIKLLIEANKPKMELALKAVASSKKQISSKIG